MADEPRIIPASAVDPLRGTGAAKTPTRPTSPADTQAFQEALKRAERGQGLAFSKHALQRIERRELTPSPQQLDRLQAGFELALSKGSRATAVLVDDLAFVVAVPAGKVVTAIDRSRMKEQIFTNIDSAVIA